MMPRALGFASNVPRAAAALFAAAITAFSIAAHAETITVGVFAPAAPFAGTAARIDFATRLAEHVATALGAEGIGRVYARANDFAAAVRRGEIRLAVVDVAYLAAGAGGGAVIAVAQRNGATAVPWQLVSRTGADRVVALRGATLLVPAIGGRETDFVLNALFGGELPRTFFGRIQGSPDVLSAVTAVGLGKADAAVVPTAITLPTGVTRVATLPAVSWPVLVAYRLSDADRAKVATAVSTFTGDPIITGFRSATRDTVTALARRFAPIRRIGPMAVPDPRIPTTDLLGSRSFAITPLDPLRFVSTPGTPSSPRGASPPAPPPALSAPPRSKR